ncbi:MAG: hypothetical protein ABEI54_02650, partial [Candidatus Bipolaricaulia bacterium]
MDIKVNLKIVCVLVLALTLFIFSGVGANGTGQTELPIEDKLWNNLKEEWKFALQLPSGLKLRGYFFTPK